ncbi:hypothetical protein BH23CHL2_BH23CHL2_25000 [soil metagenome]
MPGVCSICTHPNRQAIDRLLVTRQSSYRDIAGQYDVSRGALTRHRRDHLPALLAKAYEAEKVQADDLLREARALRGKTYRLLNRAEKEGDLKTALSGVRTGLACIELLARMRGELQTPATINVLAMPEYRTIIHVLRQQYPDAALAVSDALAGLEPSNDGAH